MRRRWPRYLAHYGVKGMKWGVRRYQNYDGTRTRAGKKRYSKYNVTAADDIIFKKGTVLSRIQKEANFDSYPFYATYKTHDKLAYLGLYGATLIARGRREARKLVAEAKANGGDVEAAKQQLSDIDNLVIYQHNLSTKADIRIPSTRRAAEITNDLIQKPRFRENLKDSISYAKANLHRPNQQIAFSKALKVLNKDDLSNLTEKEKRDVYGALNISLTFHEKSGLAVQKKFYGELKKYGYGAITDINDKIFSSYHAQDPLIFFDTSKVRSEQLVELKRDYIYRTRGPFEAERLFKEAIGAVPMIAKKRSDELYHFGIKGMHWGVRRFQRKDGTLTPKGKVRDRQNDKKNMTDAERKARNTKIRNTAVRAAIVGAAIGGTYLSYKRAKKEAAYNARMNANVQNLLKGSREQMVRAMENADKHRYMGDVRRAKNRLNKGLSLGAETPEYIRQLYEKSNRQLKRR